MSARRVLLLVVVLLLGGCKSAPVGPDAAAAAPALKPVTDVTAQDYVMPALPKARVVFTDAFGGSHPVEVEVAATRDARQRGLMWRTSLAEGQGMLFIFPAEEELSFWMKNTLIPLDMVFVSKGRSIVGIQENAEPRTLSSRSSGAPALYVIEVIGGWAGKVGLKPGLAVKIDGASGVTVTE